MAAWVIGLRAAGKAILTSLLEPTELMQEAERREDLDQPSCAAGRVQNLPVNAVWDMLCLRSGVAVGADWLEELKAYEAKCLETRA